MRLRTLIASGLVAFCCTLAWTSTANATVYCINVTNPDCEVTGGTLQSVLTTAGNNGTTSDTVRLGPYLYVASAPITFDGFYEKSVLNLASSRVNIIGAGKGAGGTVIHPAISAGTPLPSVLSVYNYGSQGSISNLKVEIPAEASTSSTTSGIIGARLDVDNVAVTTTKASNQLGIEIEEGTLSNSTVTTPTTGDTNSGVRLIGDPNKVLSIENSEITGSAPAIQLYATSDTSLDHVKVKAGITGVMLNHIDDGAFLGISDTLITTNSGESGCCLALTMENGASGTAQDFTATIDRTTIVGPNTNARGIRMYAENGDDFGLTIRDSAILTGERPVFAAQSGTGKVSVDADYSAYNTTGTNQRVVDGDPALATLTEGAHLINTGEYGTFTPGFTDSANGNYSLLATSPFVDAGQSWPTAGSWDDLAGKARPVRKDCTAYPANPRWDIGAYEYQPPAPSVTMVSGPAEGSATSDNTPTFTFSSSFACAPRFVTNIDGTTAGLVGVANTNATWTPGAPLSEGAHTFTVTATTEGQDLGTPTTRNFTVDTVAPNTTITGKSLFRARKGKANATFTLGPAEAGATFACKIFTTGYRPCTSPLLLKKLRKGSYSLSVIATDAAGNADATPAVKKFRVK